MKKTIFILLTVAALALIGYCCYWWLDDGLAKNRLGFSKERLARFSERGLRLKAELGLSDFHGPSERHVWKCPLSVTVSNQTFKISNVKRHPKCNAYFFDVGSEAEGMFKRVCGCEVCVARTPEIALDYMCGILADLNTVLTSNAYNVELDEKGNALIEEKELLPLNDIVIDGCGNPRYAKDKGPVVIPTRFKRTYGNIYMEIRLKIGAKDVPCAKDFALPLLEAGASKRFSIFGH